MGGSDHQRTTPGATPEDAPLPQFAFPGAAPAPVADERAESRRAPSVQPLALDIDLESFQAEDEVPSAERRRKRLGRIVIGVCAVAVAILGLGLARRAMAGGDDEPAAANAAPTAQAASASARDEATASGGAPSSGVPMVDVNALPAPRTGTILGPPKRAIVVDGVVVKGGRAIVTCGPHSVKTGKKARTVDVPCDGTVTVR